MKTKTETKASAAALPPLVSKNFQELADRVAVVERNFAIYVADVAIEESRERDSRTFFLAMLFGLALGFYLGRRLLEMEVEK